MLFLNLHLIGLKMTGLLIAFALLLSCWLGLLALGAQLPWHLQFQILLFCSFILCGLVVVPCMLGLVILGNHSVCLLTTSC